MRLRVCRSGRGVTWEHSFPGVSFRGKALPILLAVVSLSTVTWVLRLAQLSDLSRGSSTSTSLQTSQDKQPVDQQGSMQYLRKVGELFRAETPPVVSEGNVQTAYVTRQSPDADKQPGATRFVCLSDTHGLHSESSSNAHLLQVPCCKHTHCSCCSMNCLLVHFLTIPNHWSVSAQEETLITH